MNTTFTSKTLLSLILVVTLLLSGALLTACSGSGGFSFNLGNGQSGNGGSGGSVAGLSPIIILVLIIALVGIVALVALGALGGKK
jgi:uncharacterized spore protein YtfJ